MMQGIIYRGIGGFYDVQTAEGLICCKPRGIFRKRGQKPLAGDAVRLVNEANTWFIDEIMPRKNSLVRPPVANVDIMFIVASTTQPQPSFFVIDKLTVAAIEQGITPIVLITKTDLQHPNELQNAYEQSGIECIAVHVDNRDACTVITERMEGKLCVFCGNSGVGKSTLLNHISPELNRDTAAISRKLGRGKHTTREVQLIEMAGGLVADTPGFASFDVLQTNDILADNLQLYFPEIERCIGKCKFSGCAHMKETGCAVKVALSQGDICQSRYDSYSVLYAQAKQAENTY